LFAWGLVNESDINSRESDTKSGLSFLRRKQRKNKTKKLKEQTEEKSDSESKSENKGEDSLHYKSLKFYKLPNRKLGNIALSLRAQKILKYKLKVFQHRKYIPVIRKFNGRSEIAKTKVRVNGRFVKQIKKPLNFQVVRHD